MTKRTVLGTGSTGNVGGAVARRLLERGHGMRVGVSHFVPNRGVLWGQS